MPALQDQVEQDKTIRTGATASVIVHLSLLALLVLVSQVHPHSPATDEVEVNIVTPEEAASAAPAEAAPDKPNPEPQDKPELTLPDPSALKQPPLAAEAPPPAAPKSASAPQPAAKAQASKPEPKTAAATPPAPAPPPVAPAPPAQVAPASPAYRPAEPDISVRYNVILGLPIDAAPPTKPAKSEEGFDETTSNADIATGVLAEFRRYLKSCSKRPASVQSSDHITVKLRVALTQDGRLAADPIVGGGSANPKAIDLLQSAMAGLKQCQPYKMLPADRYGEWKVLDLDFTPKDFSG